MNRRMRSVQWLIRMLPRYRMTYLPLGLAQHFVPFGSRYPSADYDATSVTTTRIRVLRVSECYTLYIGRVRIFANPRESGLE